MIILQMAASTNKLVMVLLTALMVDMNSECQDTCDGIADCSNGVDEIVSWHYCQDTCDGIADCSNGVDEIVSWQYLK